MMSELESIRAWFAYIARARRGYFDVLEKLPAAELSRDRGASNLVDLARRRSARTRAAASGRPPAAPRASRRRWGRPPDLPRPRPLPDEPTRPR